VNGPNKLPELVRFAHAALFSPALTALQKALDRNFIHDFPGLTSLTLRNYPPPSIATIKGHLDQSRKNQRPTNKTPDPLPLLPHDDIDTDSYPQPASRTHHCFAATISTTQTGQVFSDLTGRFLTPASSGATQVFVLYDFDSNSIHAIPLKSKSAQDITSAYKTIYNTLVHAGLRPQLQRMDNECSAILRDYLADNNVSLQLVPPGVHRANAAERAIRTLKNHLIAGLCTTDPDFPMHLWDRLLPQALLTLNLLRASRINPRLSAYAQVFGTYSYNATPIAPPGTHFLIHEKPTQRASWGPHAVDAWYLGPALSHYRCYRGWVWATQRERISDTVTWKPRTVPLPSLSPLETIQAYTHQLTQAIQQYTNAAPHPPTTDPENPITAIQTLQEILNTLPAITPATVQAQPLTSTHELPRVPPDIPLDDPDPPHHPQALPRVVPSHPHQIHTHLQSPLQHRTEHQYPPTRPHQTRLNWSTSPPYPL
jgi:hypothetical protein